MNQISVEPIAAVPYIEIDMQGDHYLVGSRCSECSATLLGKRIACASCGTQGALTFVRLGMSGRVRTCATIHRSYPGVTVPFVAAVVDLDGGGVIRGTLHTKLPDDPSSEVGKTVRVCIEDSGQRDHSGRAYYCHVFRPEGNFS